ncbi:MAG: DNA-binding response regulator, partial [Flavobacterium sp.]
FETAIWLKENHPKVLIMALSMQDDEKSLIKMIRNGAHGYLLKNISPLELKDALSTLLLQKFFYPDWVSKIIISSFKDNEIVINLSDREKEFLNYVATELTYKEIADKMCCSPRTIDGYRNSLFEKLNVKTRVGLAVYALKNKET